MMEFSLAPLMFFGVDDDLKENEAIEVLWNDEMNHEL